MSKDIVVEHNGQTHSMTEWAMITGISKSTLFKRYYCGYRGDKLFAKVNITNCKICGKEFVSKSPIAKCCSKECKRINNNILANEHNRRIKEITEIQRTDKKEKKEKKYTVTEIAVKAKEAGMSYGQYVAKMNIS